jgi:hypothetical protein
MVRNLPSEGEGIEAVTQPLKFLCAELLRFAKKTQATAVLPCRWPLITVVLPRDSPPKAFIFVLSSPARRLPRTDNQTGGPWTCWVRRISPYPASASQFAANSSGCERLLMLPPASKAVARSQPGDCRIFVAHARAASGRI